MLFRRTTTIALLLVAVAVTAGSAFAQGAEAEINGTITDTSGAAIPGAQVTLTNADTGVTRSIITQADGQYRFAPVPPVLTASASKPRIFRPRVSRAW